jgi:hypothetical protein
MSLAAELGTITAVDIASRTLVDSLEIAVPLDAARVALLRKPDFDDRLIVSWGRLTREEVVGLLALEHDERDRADLQDEFDALLAGATPRCFTLYYSERSRGE